MDAFASTPQIITSVNRKGGVGKTHLCWLTASVCQERGRRCLVVDLDPQANFTNSFVAESDIERSVDELFDRSREPEAQPLIVRTDYEWIDVIPSSSQLEALNESNPTAWWQGDLHLSLTEALEPIRDDYDFILLDCPPSLSLVTYAALCASDFVMIPMEAARWGALGTQQIIAAMSEVQARFNRRLTLLGYVASRYKARRAYQQTYLAQLREHFGDDAFDTVIPDLAAFEKAVTDRIPLTLHSPTSHAARIARQFFDELDARCQRLAGLGRSHRRRSVSKPAQSTA